MEIKLHCKTWVKEEISKETKHLELDKNEKTTYQNLWDMRKAVLKGNLRTVTKADLRSVACVSTQETRKRAN